MPIAASLRQTLLAALLGFTFAAQAAPKAPAAISFDTTPRAGQHQRLQIDMQAAMKMQVEAGPDATDAQRAKIAQAAQQMSQNGLVNMSMQMQQTTKVDAADANGWLPLTVTVASKGGRVEVGGNTVPLPTDKAADMKFSARFNPKNFAFELNKVDTGQPQLTEMMNKQGQTLISETLQLYKALSQRPLKIGESVNLPLTMALPMPMPGGAGAMQGTVEYKLVRVDKGVAHFDLRMDLKMNIDTPLPKPAAAASAVAAASAPSAASNTASAGAVSAEAPPQMLHMAVTGSGKGTSALRLADRLPLSSQLAMDMKMVMDGPDNGRMTIDMDMVMRSTGENLAQAPAKKKR